MAAFAYEFEWDPLKAETNITKHGVTFERASEVFGDPLALTIPDDEHSVGELRWITLGKDARNQYVLVVHTYDQPSETRARVRIISARQPSQFEIHEYEDSDEA